MKYTKRLLTVLLAIMIIAIPIFSVSVSAASVNKVTALLGDVDGNGRITVRDATTIQKSLSGMEILDPLSKKLADVDGNGKVVIKDVSTLQKWLSGSKISYAIGKTVTYSASTIIVKVNDAATGNFVGNAVYGLYVDKTCTKLLETANSRMWSGEAVFEDLYVDGTYYVKQITSPDNFTADTKVYTLNVKSALAVDGACSLQVKIKQAPKTLFIQNYDAEDTRPWMYLKGGVFGVYSDKACTKLVATIDDQYSEAVFTAGQTFYVKQLEAPKGYKLNTEVHSITIPTNQYTYIVAVQVLNSK